MFIQTEETPNPNTLKFIPGVQVLEEGTVEFKDKESAKISNLGNIIFLINGIERVFLATEFVSVTKKNDVRKTIIKYKKIIESFNIKRPNIKNIIFKMMYDISIENKN